MTINKLEKELVNALLEEIYAILKNERSEYANGKAQGYLQSCQKILAITPHFDEELVDKVDKAWADIIKWSPYNK